MRFSAINVCFFILSIVLHPVTLADGETDGASMDEIISGVQKLCGGKGTGTDIQVNGEGEIQASKTVSLIVNGKIKGTVNFSKSEWDGIRAMQDDAPAYAQCVQQLTPIFLEKFSKKK